MEGKSNGAGKICPLTREEAVRQLSDLRDHCRSMISGDNDYPEWALDVEALDMAIAALLPVSREQVEKVWPGCDFCKIELDDYPYIVAHSDYSSSDTCYEPSFCPICGKPLTDEAEEMMLERWKEALE